MAITASSQVYLTLHRNLESDGDAEASSKAGKPASTPFFYRAYFWSQQLNRETFIKSATCVNRADAAVIIAIVHDYAMAHSIPIASLQRSTRAWFMLAAHNLPQVFVYVSVKSLLSTVLQCLVSCNRRTFAHHGLHQPFITRMGREY